MEERNKGGLVKLFCRNQPRRAVESAWLQLGRRVSRRALLIVGVALIGGPLAYIVLPVPVAAQSGAVAASPSPGPTSAAPLRVAALIGGLVEPGDLVTDPVGVVSNGAELGAEGDLIGWPVSDHTPSTGFGYRSDPFTHRQRWHDGVDLGQPCGDPAVASLAGTVVNAGWAGGYGNRVVLRHAERSGQSFATTYNHLAQITVAVGQDVAKGGVVGRIGSTGRSTACHMHFEVILDGSYVDPMRFLTGDASKAGLSRRVGSVMPSGVPSPGASSSRTATRTPSPTTPSPTTTPTPTPTTPSAGHTPTPSPFISTPGPTISTPGPTISTPGPTTPAADPATQTPGATPTPGSSTPASITSGSTPASTTPASTTPASTTPASTTPGSTPAGSTPASTTAAASTALGSTPPQRVAVSSPSQTGTIP